MMRIRRFASSLLPVLLLLAASPVAAKFCGDDVDGSDVPCACGDTVVSSVVLGSDPVTQMRCPNDGLIVRAPQTVDTVEVDLNGRSLRGSGKGAGIWIISGGKNGARIVSNSGPAVIEGFRDGIIGRTPGGVRVIDDITVSGNKRDGIQVFSNDVQIRGSEARESGRDGISVRGKRWLLQDVRSVDSRRYGVNANGVAGTLGVRRGGVVVENSGRIGINVMGSGHRIIDCVAIGGHGDGLATAGAHHEVNGCLVLDNAGTGINGTSSLDRVRNNRAEGNGANGVLIRGHGVQDAGGNVGLGNGTTMDPQTAKQCEIGGVSCR